MREMKDSGIPWIGQISADWSIVKIKAGVHKVGSGKTPSGGATTYADEGILFLRSQNVYDTGLELSNPTYITPEVDEEMKGTRVFPNDVLLNITGGSIGRCCIFPKSLKTANVNQHVSIIRVNQDVFLPEYMHYYWVSPLGSLAIDLYQTGGNREGMSADAIKNTPIILISLDEQRRICRVLDDECSKIDSVLAKIRTSIEEYEKLKQAIITQAVTKGVRGDRPMKESGIEQIPKIPEDWDVVSLKRCIDILPGYAFSSQDFDSGDGIPLLRGINVGINEIRWENVVYWNKPLDDTLKVFRLEENDIVVGLDRPWIAGGMRVAFVQGDDLPCLLLQRVCRIRPDANIDRRLIFYWISSDIFKETLSNKTTGVSVPHISTKQIEQFIIAIPPNQEDRDICDYLDKQCEKIDSIIQKKERFLTELETYKKSLIYEYVTGKKEVGNFGLF